MASVFGNINRSTASGLGTNALACPVKAHAALTQNENAILSVFIENQHRDAIPLLKKRLSLVQAMRTRAFMENDAFQGELYSIIRYCVEIGERFAHLNGDENVCVLEETLKTAIDLYEALRA